MISVIFFQRSNGKAADHSKPANPPFLSHPVQIQGEAILVPRAGSARALGTFQYGFLGETNANAGQVTMGNTGRGRSWLSFLKLTLREA